MKTKWISIMLLVIAAIVGIVCWLVLPETVTVQIGTDGQASNTLPKLPAVLIMLGISVAGTVMNLRGKTEKKTRGFVLTIAGIAAMLATLLMNR